MATTREDVIQALAGERAPMVLVPQQIKDAVAKRRFLERRWIKWSTVVACLFVLFAALGATILAAGLVFQPVSFKLIIMGGLLLAITFAGCLITAVRTGKLNPDVHASKPLDGLGYSLNDFADRFVLLMDALREDSAYMGRWPLVKVRIYAERSLRALARTIKREQKEDPDNPFAGLAHKQMFLDMHLNLKAGGLDMGPYGPFFEDEPPPGFAA